MPNLKYGFAEMSDLKKLLGLYATLRPGDPPYAAGEAETTLTNVLAQQHIRIIVARIDGTAVATCMLALLANFASGGRPIGYLEHVVTAERFRGQGIARGMLTYALDVAWQQNCCKVVLLSGSHRDPRMDSMSLSASMVKESAVRHQVTWMNGRSWPELRCQLTVRGPTAVIGGCRPVAALRALLCEGPKFDHLQTYGVTVRASNWAFESPPKSQFTQFSPNDSMTFGCP